MKTKNILRVICVIVVVVFIVVLTQIFFPSEEQIPTDVLSDNFKNFPKEPNFVSAGVVVYGYNRNGWIENTNSFPVKIIKINTTGYGRSDITLWIQIFEPGQIKEENFVSDRGRFHIYGANGRPIGLITPQKPADKKK